MSNIFDNIVTVESLNEILKKPSILEIVGPSKNELAILNKLEQFYSLVLNPYQAKNFYDIPFSIACASITMLLLQKGFEMGRKSHETSTRPSHSSTDKLH